MDSPTKSTNAKTVRFILSLVAVLAIITAYRLSGLNEPATLVSAPAGQASGSSANQIMLNMQREAVADAPLEELAAPVAVAWQEGQTALEATLLAAKESPDWQSKWQNQGEMAFLTTLGGHANEGAQGLNWQFDLNGDYSMQGAGQTVLKPGDAILWRLAPYK